MSFPSKADVSVEDSKIFLGERRKSYCDTPLPHSYRQRLLLPQCEASLAERDLLFEQPFCAVHMDSYWYEGVPGISWPLLVRSQLVLRQLIRNSCPEAAVDYMGKLLDRIAVSGLDNKLAISISIILRLFELDVTQKESEKNEQQIYSLLCATTLAQVREHGEQIIYHIAQQTVRIGPSGEYSLFNDIIHFVRNHYTDEQMSLKLLSEEFQVSIYYISKFFKNIAGCNFSQYITTLRLKRAQELLTSTNKPLCEITAEVGYVDESSFLRKFKSTFGETPGQYRKRERHHE